MCQSCVAQLINAQNELLAQNTLLIQSFHSLLTPEPPSVSPTSNVGDPSFVSPESNSGIPDSFIFTKKAKCETKESTILQALQQSVLGRRDKTRAFVDELHYWQNELYVDAHYNAKVMYDELEKLTPLSFGYEVFKKYYNNTI